MTKYSVAKFIDAKYDTFAKTMEWPIVLMSWIKFNQAAYENQINDFE